MKIDREKIEQKKPVTRLYHVTAHWTDHLKQYSKEFIIGATDSKTAKTIAHNRVPLKLTKNEKPNISDNVEFHIRDLGIPQPRRTYYTGETIIKNSTKKELDIQLKQKWAVTFGIMWGYETAIMANDKTQNRKSIQILTNYEDKTNLLYQWANEYIKSNGTDYQSFFHEKIKQLIEDNITET